MFIDIVFPQILMPHFSKNIGYNTGVGIVQSGIEYRRLVTPGHQTIYKMFQSVKQLQQITALTDFFHTTKGKTHSFKLHDITDCKVEKMPPQLLNNTQVQIQKIVNINGQVYCHSITKPVIETVLVYKNDVQMQSGYTINYESGQITFTENISQFSLAISCNYFQHVRFNSESISMKTKSENAIEVDSLEIITVI